MPTSKIRVPMRYVPRTLSRKDRRRQIAMLKRSRRLYKRGKYYGRTTKLKSYPHVASKHTDVARRMYRVDHIVPNAALAKATKCSIGALQKIVKKGGRRVLFVGVAPQPKPAVVGLRPAGQCDHGGQGGCSGLRHFAERVPIEQPSAATGPNREKRRGAQNQYLSDANQMKNK